MADMIPAQAEAPIREITYLGVPISCLDVAAAAERIAERGATAPFAYVVTPNAQHFVRLGRLKDERFADAYAHAWLRLLDGKTPRALARRIFGLDIPHAAGSDLTAHLFAHHITPFHAFGAGCLGVQTTSREACQIGVDIFCNLL